MKKIVSFALAVLMICTVIPFAAIPAFAADNITEYYCLDVSAGAVYYVGGTRPL